jgi:hypothetical protein
MTALRLLGLRKDSEKSMLLGRDMPLEIVRCGIVEDEGMDEGGILSCVKLQSMDLK